MIRRRFAARRCALAFVLAAPAGCGSRAPNSMHAKPSTAEVESATAAGARFLASYVDPDGRVVRRDQGGDTVSEGQAYAMLIAVALGDERLFDTIWSWTRDNLRRPDGLLAWHWDGRILDPGPASDGDIDAAHALHLAGARWHRDDLRRSSAELGHAILTGLTAPSGSATVLAAGLWGRSSPATINPSYLALRAFQDLAAAPSTSPTDRRAWQRLLAGSHRALNDLTRQGRTLPPDWATVTTSGVAAPVSGPAGESVRYSFDATRVPLRLGQSCAPADREVAASLASRLAGAADGTVDLHLDGAIAAPQRSPAAVVALATAQLAGGNRDKANRSLAGAADLDRTMPTYFGSALIALGAIASAQMNGQC